MTRFAVARSRMQPRYRKKDSQIVFIVSTCFTRLRRSARHLHNESVVF